MYVYSPKAFFIFKFQSLSNEQLSMLMKEWRSVGKRAFGFKVLVDLTSDEAYVYERAVLQAIGMS